jgi:hypothetical protein
VVSSADQRSTRLIQLLEVGVKCSPNRGVLAQPALDLRGLVTGDVVQDQVLGHGLLDALEEREELDRAVALVQRPMTSPDWMFSAA